MPTNPTRDDNSGRPACTALIRTVLVRTVLVGSVLVGSVLVGCESRLGQGVDSAALLAARNLEAILAACGFTTVGFTTVGFTIVGRWSEIHVSATLLPGTARADDRFARSIIVSTSDFRAGLE